MAHSQNQLFEDLIQDQEGITCQILVSDTSISISVPVYADFLLAKRVIAGRVSVPIVHDFLPQLSKKY